MRLAVVLLAACVDAEVGRPYECTAALLCDGTRYEVSPAHGCAEDEVDALDRYRSALAELADQAQCHHEEFVDVACVRQSGVCSP